MKLGSTYRVMSLAATAIMVSALSQLSVADAKSDSFFDTVWNQTKLYKNEDNHLIQKFVLSGRLHTDTVELDADQGQFEDAFLWRRFRFGFKSNLFHEWVLHLEGDFDLNESTGDRYSRLTDAYIGWTPAEELNFKILKQSAGFTLDGATSSKKLLTMQRNNLTNNLWFTREYFTGINIQGEVDGSWKYKAGVFSSDGNEELSHFNASYFTLVSVGYQFRESPGSGGGLIRIDHVYNNEDSHAATRDFSQVFSLVSFWETGSWGLLTDLSLGRGYAKQTNVWGIVLEPYYDFSPKIQGVLRYTYISSAGDNGVRLPRYESRAVDGRGDEFNEFHVGINVYFYAHKLKWQTGLEFASMKDNADDSGRYRGWSLSTGLRVYW